MKIKGLAADIQSITAPTLLLWGDVDPVSPVAVGNRFAALLPTASRRSSMSISPASAVPGSAGMHASFRPAHPVCLIRPCARYGCAKPGAL